MSDDLNNLAFDPALAAEFAAWRTELAAQNQGSLAEFWLRAVPFAKAWQDKAFNLLAISRPTGKRYAELRDRFLGSAMPGVDKGDLTALLWLGDDDHIAIAREHIRSRNWAGDIRKLNSPRAIRNAVQKVVNERAEAAELATENERRRDNGEATVEMEAEDDYDNSIQAMLDQDEMAAEDDPAKGVVGAYLRSLKYHNTLARRIIAVKGDKFMREMCMNALLDIHETEMKARVGAGKKPQSITEWFKANGYEAWKA